MRTHTFSFRRKWFDPSNKEDKGTPYGNATEKVESGPNKGQEVPCFLVETNLVPETYAELGEHLESDENFNSFMSWAFETGILEEARKFFTKQKSANPAQETTAAGRAEVIEKILDIGKRFTLSSMFAKALNATSIVDLLSSPEMRALALTNPGEYSRRSLEIMKAYK